MFVVLMISGCATSPVADNTAGDDIQIKKISSSKSKIGYVKVSRNETTTLVRGSIRRSTPSRISLGHIHVDMYNAANTLIDQTIVSSRMRKNGNHVAISGIFKAELNTPAPFRAKIVIEHHRGNHHE